jgi:hypothetical protein
VVATGKIPGLKLHGLLSQRTNGRRGCYRGDANDFDACHGVVICHKKPAFIDSKSVVQDPFIL